MATTAFCRGGSSGGGAWRHSRGFAGYAHRRQHDRTRSEGAGCAASANAQSDSPAWRGTQVADANDPPIAGRSERAGRARGARRSDVAAALDVQESAPAGRRTRKTRAQGQPHGCRRVAEEAEVQPASQSQDREGADNPDRDTQFRVVSDAVKAAMAENQPAISVDTKKKELVGDFKNAGREWRRQGDPEEVRVHDFLIKELGRAVPYGIYDLAANAGWGNVGIDNDTAAFAVQTIRRWWQD